MLYISGFMDDVMISYHGTVGGWTGTMPCTSLSVATGGAQATMGRLAH